VDALIDVIFETSGFYSHAFAIFLQTYAYGELAIGGGMSIIELIFIFLCCIQKKAICIE
jgi:hypothetical protein